MFTNAQRQVERTGRSGTPRDKYLQVGPIPPFLLLLPRDWCQRVLLLESILQICFLSINPFRLIERGQDLVTQFQNATDEESKEKIVANLANFAYDPFNYAFMRQLNVLELFLDCITEPNERLIEFGIGGICNSCVDPANALVIVQCGGIPLVIQCLSSPVRNTVTYALGALYYLCNPATKKEILKPDVVRIIREYASGAVNTSFSNMANAFLEKHVDS
ncbi:hypothetical protein PVAP13_9KG099300 [Panicum virgatum]|uniref:Armadillo repeat-containing protein 7 n=1 Tax=Panicum virgatum TaxID=38727 RepID=A0A8T0NK51_PANVG|nr:hypothetical protein PVAP13_9KG099300 [Panicum virgatum]